ncbi:MAG: YraN family protein [Paracoccus sp. (in: a-proteobacteria)]|uniref:YraN family protein n=1 Tax=Paracoccus sp. TaxID=267 RepID=UPI0026DF1EDE|nr:YraN family protein [Paracoccus sp. (in: a-proteobacteria)]MDO5631954.1 YraN family protein [Paracoccus sp. (in: a-proteobacteria)]
MTVHVREFRGAGPTVTRSRRGALACLSGAMAEDNVATRYQAAGAEILARRWRGRAGEIDLIVQQGDCVIFVEVKKSRTHELAALRLDRRQMDRICGAALEYCGTLSSGSLTEMRFDVALVDDSGRIDVIENAFGEN